MNKKESLLDQSLLIPFAILTAISIVFIYSSSSVVADTDFGNQYFYLQRQLIALSIGLLAGSIFLFIPISFYKENGLLLILFSAFLLTLVFIPGIGVEKNGSLRWINIGFNIQPSEIAKIFVPIYLCGYCLRRKEQLENSWWGFIKPLILTSIISILLLLEMDLGATVVIFAIGIIILFIGGAKFNQLLLLFLVFLSSVILIAYFNEERWSRVVSFSNPWDDVGGSDYQLINALVASVQGGFSGLGIGESTQKYYFLPESHTDFIFSIFVEETGVIGMSILFACYLMILWRLFRLADRSMKKNFFFNSLLISFFALLFFMQTSLNIFVNLGLIPTKGLALPFISYGRSSVIMNFIALAITLRASWEFRNNIK